MKYIFFLFFLNISFAKTISLKDPCNGKTVFKSKIKPAYDGLSIGKVTIDYFDEYKINFQGSEQGISQILNTPIGDKALVILDDENLLAFGWCYTINGVVPNKYADKIIYSSKINSITWFYGYSRNRKNKWLNMCKRASKLPQKFNPSCKKSIKN